MVPEGTDTGGKGERFMGISVYGAAPYTPQNPVFFVRCRRWRMDSRVLFYLLVVGEPREGICKGKESLLYLRERFRRGGNYACEILLPSVFVFSNCFFRVYRVWGKGRRKWGRFLRDYLRRCNFRIYQWWGRVFGCYKWFYIGLYEWFYEWIHIRIYQWRVYKWIYLGGIYFGFHRWWIHFQRIYQWGFHFWVYEWIYQWWYAGFCGWGSHLWC